jgi:hypothetical protein
MIAEESLLDILVTEFFNFKFHKLDSDNVGAAVTGARVGCRGLALILGWVVGCPLG